MSLEGVSLIKTTDFSEKSEIMKIIIFLRIKF